MHDKAAENGEALEGINQALDRLLGSEGCPWDKEQTTESLSAYLLEEAYELADAVRNGSTAEQREELGDVFFILLFMSRLWDKAGSFTLAETLKENRAKMIGRHPHVFSEHRAISKDDVLTAWEEIKKAEKAKKESRPGVFGSLPVGLPALLKAYRIHSKSAANKFTWDTDEDAERQVEAEWLELIDADRDNDQEAREHELGDLIFSLVELGRRKGIKAEAALEKANTRFLRRFKGMEALADARGLDFSSLDQAAKDALWEEIKAGECKAE
ncbi:MAG: nucleoside triphosphate pyrophosphohydrolase [Deltaproteobacteria bacterium]|jgi:ATP diphosphatase|nr:nucleoside triphosphate pyrophosphohydrolase [Deltaproteobacteria bacterium]